MAVSTRSTSTASSKAHRETVSESVASIASFLADLLGTRLTARLAGVDTSSISRWKSGAATPQEDSEHRLRAAHQVARLLLAVDADHTVRAWFIGMNPQLDDEAPIDAIAAGDTKAVLAAARSFIDGA
ncbi:MAG: hypothetical protein RLZZ623_280 [Actinomycetota bacterium]|jgi:hypothetical protein